MKNIRRIESDIEICATRCIHPHTIRLVGPQMPDRTDLDRLAEFYKLFGDSTRLGIISALGASEMCVCDLSALLAMKQPAVSHQLRTLKQARIIKSRRDGKVIYYSLADDHIRLVLDVGIKHLREKSKDKEHNHDGDHRGTLSD